MVDKEGELATLQQEPISNGSVCIGTSFLEKKGEAANQHPRQLQNDHCVRVVRVPHNARAAEEDKWASGGAGCSQGSLDGMGYTVQREGFRRSYGPLCPQEGVDQQLVCHQKLLDQDLEQYSSQ
jgi:hypothetical protein